MHDFLIPRTVAAAAARRDEMLEGGLAGIKTSKWHGSIREPVDDTTMNAYM